VGTLVVVAIVAWFFPQLRSYGRLDAEAAKALPSAEAAVELEAEQSEAPRTAG
jgi:hypothetical protein